MQLRTKSPEHELVAFCLALAVITVLLDIVISSVRF